MAPLDPSPGIEFRILGRLEVLDGGRVVTLGGPKQRALLAVFMLHANETLNSDRLIDVLWGEHAPATRQDGADLHLASAQGGAD